MERKNDIQKLIDNSDWSIKLYIGMLIFFLTLQLIVGFLAPVDMKNHWIVLFAACFIEILLVRRMVKLELKYKNKLIVIRDRIK